MFANCLSRIVILLGLGLVPLWLCAAERPVPRLQLDSPRLTAAEKFVLAQTSDGKPADLRSQFSEETNRVLRAAFVEALLTQTGTNVHRNGFSIAHAVIPDALDLHNAEVHHETSLIECRFAGETDFSKSTFENGLSLTGSTFAGAANFSSMKVGRLADFDHARFRAAVNAVKMDINGGFTAREAQFESQGAPVNFNNLNTAGDAIFSQTTFAGPVSFRSAHIGANWRFDGSRFFNPSVLIDFEEARVGGTTTFGGCGFAGYVSFKDARFNALDLSKVIWPATHDDTPWLWLNGMTYARIGAGAEKDSWQNLLALVQRTARGSAYSADVFARLADHYRLLGYPRQANSFFRAMKKREREEVLSGHSWVWSFFLEQFVGYGRSPERAIFWSVAIIGFGCLMFRPNRMELQNDLQRERKYSVFWYSVDVYLPVIKLHDAEIWKPKEEYVLTHVWRRIHTVLGWALIPIALAAWTGMLAQ